MVLGNSYTIVLLVPDGTYYVLSGTTSSSTW